jgi:sterol 14alpha-demethylase
MFQYCTVALFFIHMYIVQLRGSADLNYVQDHFAKWRQQGTADPGKEFGQLIMLMTGRCLLGKEVREKMLDEFFTLYHKMADNGTALFTLLYPYAPTLENYRRDRARTKLAEMLAKIVRSRKISNLVEEDVLQNLIDSKYKDGRPTTESGLDHWYDDCIDHGCKAVMLCHCYVDRSSSSPPSKMVAVAIKVQKEIISKKGNCIDYSTLLTMDNLHCCIKETLRMHPPVPALLRKVHKDYCAD